MSRANESKAPVGERRSTHTPHATLDLETRSACQLRDCGSYKYAMDPTTRVLCMAFRMPYWKKGRVGLWHPSFRHLEIQDSANEDECLELIQWIDDGGLVECHNAMFERPMWIHQMVPRYGWPSIPGENFRCSAAKAAAHALPRKLAEAGAALHLDIQKDDEGHKLMMKLSKPRKPRKKERELWEQAGKSLVDMPLLWHEDLASFQRLWRYCESDVLAEEALSEALDDLSPEETANYILDQTMNQRGFKLDLEAVDIALSLIQTESALLNSELAGLTNGAVTRATQRDRLKAWLTTQGVTMFDTKGATIDTLLQEDDANQSAGPDELPPWVETVPPAARRALEILRTLGRSSTAKFETMRDWAASDGRVRGALLFHGASTGRWSGAGVQPQNFPKGTIKGFDMGDAWRLIKTGDRDAILAKYPSVMEVLSCALRGAIVASKGKQLFVADYAGVEVRVLWWVARDKVGLNLLKSGADPYCALASDIYQRLITKEDKNERQLGKAAVLGAGYGLGFAKFVTVAATYGVTIDDTFAQTAIDAYRSKFHRVKSFWYETEDAACLAVKHPGRVVENGYCSWQRVIDKQRGTDFLFCTLPSGRKLSYPFPELRQRETPWGALKMALTFMGMDTYTKKWKRQHTYGGSLVENCIAEETEILTDRGWLEIQEVLPTDRVWDGLDWTTHGGVVYKGVQSTISCDGVEMTPDHRVLTSQGWIHASSSGRHQRADVWLPEGYTLRGRQREEVTLGNTLCVREISDTDSERTTSGTSQVLRLQEERHVGPESSFARNEQTPGILGVAQHVRPLSAPHTPSMEELRRSGHQGVPDMARWIPSVLGGHGSDVSIRSDYRTQGQRQGILAGQLLLGDLHGTSAESSGSHSNQRHVARRVCDQPRDIKVHRALATQTRVFDILNCGPAQRFVVRNYGQTRCLVVHNCVQAIARDLMAAGLQNIEASNLYKPVLSIHDEALAEAPIGQGSVREFEQLLTVVPEWGHGCPISAEGWVGARYKKG